jgi:allophanate hydrolase
VPAGLQNIVGLKPSLGLVSTAGVVPACRTLDCVSIFALTVDDAWAALTAVAGPDPADPFSRPRPVGHPGALPPGLRVGLPARADRDFDGDAASAAAFEAAVALLDRLGCRTVDVDFAPFREAARLLYEGPWVAERWLVIRHLLARDADAIHPVTREVIAGRPLPSAADFFAARYRLAELARTTAGIFAGIDALMVPTMPRPVTLAEIAREPVALNSMLGRYTNFVNLLDLCGLAVPVALERDRTAHGVTFLAEGGRDAVLAMLGRVFHTATALPLGATGTLHPKPAAELARAPDGQIELAVVGAHLSGMPLNHQLLECAGSFVRVARTSADYRLYVLPGATPPRPGLLRVGPGEGAPIAIEIWSLPADGFGRFVAKIPPPLCVATLNLDDGSTVQGFAAEAEGTRGAEDITRFGGWRAYRSAAAPV